MTRRFEIEGIDHVALAVRDVAVSVAWYREVLGLERMFEDAWGEYPAVVGKGTTSIALFPVVGDDPQPRPDRNVLAMRHVAFRANRESFLGAQTELSARGIEFAFQDHVISHSIYFDDPDGHQLEITTYEV